MFLSKVQLAGGSEGAPKTELAGVVSRVSLPRRRLAQFLVVNPCLLVLPGASWREGVGNSTRIASLASGVESVAHFSTAFPRLLTVFRGVVGSPQA